MNTQTAEKSPVAVFIEETFGKTVTFAAVIGKNPSTASEIKRRGSIPVEYWPAIVRAAAEAGVEGVTNDMLVDLHVNQSTHEQAEPVQDEAAA